MTIAMHRASPIRINPMAYSGLSARNASARPNIRRGPITQLSRSEMARIFVLRKTCGNSS